MIDAMIAPQGLIRGTVLRDLKDRKEVPRYDALILRDGWVQHIAKLRLESEPWQRMHRDPKIEQGVSEADFPVPLAVCDKHGIYGVGSYEAMIVRNGEMFRYSHDNVEWRNRGDNPMMRGVTGAPTMFRAEDNFFGVLLSTIQAFVPIKTGLWHFSYITDWDMWLPRGIIVSEETGWPTGFGNTKNDYLAFFETSGKLRCFYFNRAPLFYDTSEIATDIAAPWGAATGIQGFPSINFDGPFPTIVHDDYQLIVPRAEKNGRDISLVHYWRSVTQTSWNSSVLPGSYTGSAALISVGPSPIAKPYKRHEGSDDHMLALAPKGNDIYSITRNGETGIWSYPVLAL